VSEARDQGLEVVHLIVVGAGGCRWYVGRLLVVSGWRPGFWPRDSFGGIWRAAVSSIPPLPIALLF
jgi:hypothetical protein